MISPIPVSDLPGIGIVASANAVLMFIAYLWKRFGTPDGETTRKFVHLGTGMICLSFPTLFSSHWSVFLLAIGFVSLMMATQRWGGLQAIHDVDRPSNGGVYYPLAVWIVFMISSRQGHPEFYVASILVLAICDAVAALVGKRYGEHRYQVEGSRRSLEGSVMFFVSSFTVIHLVLSLASDFGRQEAALAALYVAGIVTVLESISLSGTDNLWIPLGTMAVLLNLTTKSSGFLVSQILYLAFSLAFAVVILSRHRELGLAPRAALGLLAYSCHAFQGPSWSVAVFTGLALAAFGRTASLRIPETTRVRPVFLCVVPILGWNLAARYLHMDESLAFPAFATSIAGVLAYLWTRSCPGSRIARPLRAGFVAVAIFSGHALMEPSWSHLFHIPLVALGAWAVDLAAHWLRPRFDPATHGLRALTVASVFVSLVVWLACEGYPR